MDTHKPNHDYRMVSKHPVQKQFTPNRNSLEKYFDTNGRWFFLISIFDPFVSNRLSVHQCMLWLLNFSTQHKREAVVVFIALKKFNFVGISNCENGLSYLKGTQFN